MFLEANQIKKGHTEDKFEKDMKPLVMIAGYNNVNDDLEQIMMTRNNVKHDQDDAKHKYAYRKETSYRA